MTTNQKISPCSENQNLRFRLADLLEAAKQALVTLERVGPSNKSTARLREAVNRERSIGINTSSGSSDTPDSADDVGGE